MNDSLPAKGNTPVMRPSPPRLPSRRAAGCHKFVEMTDKVAEADDDQHDPYLEHLAKLGRSEDDDLRISVHERPRDCRAPARPTARRGDHSARPKWQVRRPCLGATA
jgi:hypothetical protein